MIPYKQKGPSGPYLLNISIQLILKLIKNENFLPSLNISRNAYGRFLSVQPGLLRLQINCILTV